MSSTLKIPKCSKCACPTYTYMGLLGLDQTQVCECCDEGRECPQEESPWTKYMPDFSCDDIQLPHLGYLDLGLDEDDD